MHARGAAHRGSGGASADMARDGGRPASAGRRTEGAAMIILFLVVAGPAIDAGGVSAVAMVAVEEIGMRTYPGVTT